MSTNNTTSDRPVSDSKKENTVRWGGFVALLFAMVFFSGLLGGKGAWSVLDFTTLNGAFGRVAADVTSIQVTPREMPTVAPVQTEAADATSAQAETANVVPAQAETTDATQTEAETANATLVQVEIAQATPIQEYTATATVAKTTYRGVGGRGAMEGFLFAFGLIPAVMFALAMINVLEHYGALDAARKLLTPILRPLLGIPGSSGLALIGSLQSTDVGASLTRQLSDEKLLTEDQRDVFIMFQFSAGAMITNFFSSGAVLFTLMMADGITPVVPASLGLCVAVMFVMKIFGANVLRLIFSMTSKKASSTPAA